MNVAYKIVEQLMKISHNLDDMFKIGKPESGQSSSLVIVHELCMNSLIL